MAKKRQNKPTDAELEILTVLWEQEPCTVREIHQTLSKSREIGYTTVLKLMQIMTEKGLIVRDETNRSHVYQSKVKQDRTQRQLVGELLRKAFGGSTDQLVMQALRAKKVTPEEISNIKKLLDEIDD